jgi:hypothetical protein
MEKSGGERTLQRPRRNWEDSRSIKSGFKMEGVAVWFGFSGLMKGPVMNMVVTPSRSARGGKFIEQMIDCQLHNNKKNPAPRS